MPHRKLKDLRTQMPPIDQLVLTGFACSALLCGGISMLLAHRQTKAQAVEKRLSFARGQFGTESATKVEKSQPEQFQFTDNEFGLSIPEQAYIAVRLAKLGIPASRSTQAFFIGRLVLGGACAALGYVVALAIGWQPVAIAALFAAIAYIVPSRIIKAGVRRHSLVVANSLPDAFDLLAICADAGLSIEGALHRVSQALTDYQPELAAELSMTWAQLAILPSREQALQNLAARINLPSLRTVVITVSQSMRLGSPLAQSLRNAASELRADSLARLEERANRLPALMTIPMMGLIMPTIFLVIGGPAALKILDFI
jgi:tight adherence protein C